MVKYTDHFRFFLCEKIFNFKIKNIIFIVGMLCDIQVIYTIFSKEKKLFKITNVISVLYIIYFIQSFNLPIQYNFFCSVEI